MTKLSTSLMAATAALTAALLGSTPASADVTDRNTEKRGGMLAGAQTPSVSEKGSFVHRGKAIVWVPNEKLEQSRTAGSGTVVVREAGSATPRVRAVTSRGAFVQNGKITTFVPSESLAEHLRNASPSRSAYNPAGRVVLLGGAEVHRDLLANLSEDYVMAPGSMTQPPAVTGGGAFIHSGKTTKWVPSTNSGPMLGQ